MQNGNSNLLKERETWLDGLKGILCLQVFLGHFYIAFFWDDIIPAPNLFHNFIIFLNSGCVTVPLFCCISGYLLDKKRCEKIYDFLIAGFNRFLRFEIPLLPLFFIIMFLIRKTNLCTYNVLLAEQLTNKRLLSLFPQESHFTYLFRKPFYDPALASYIGPLWMIKPLFVGGVLLYLKNLIVTIAQKYKPGKKIITEVVLFVLLFLYFSKDKIGASVIFGGLINTLAATPWFDRLKAKVSSLKIIINICTGLILIGHLLLYLLYNMETFYLPASFDVEGLLFSWYLFVFLLLTDFKKIFSAKIFQGLGKCSFGIYVLHDFIIGLFSCIAIFYLKESLGFPVSVLIVFVITVIMVLLLAYVFSLWERASSKCIKRLCSFLATH